MIQRPKRPEGIIPRATTTKEKKKEKIIYYNIKTKKHKTKAYTTKKLPKG